MKIVFWGTPKYAADNLKSIINEGYEVIAVVTQPDRKRSRGKTLSPSPVKQVALDYDIPVYSTKSISKDQKTKDLLFNLNADVYLVVAFGQILPSEILNHPKLGCWNSHASLLPVWRGAAPIQWSIMNDDAQTGVCIMAMEQGLDTGPVIEKESTIIGDNDNLEILTSRLSSISSKLLIKSLKSIKETYGLNKFERLEKLKATKQSNLDGIASYARQIKKEDYIIDWNQNARKIINKIKALYPNAYTIYNKKRIKIIEACLLINNDESQINKMIDTKRINACNPGEIIILNPNIGIIITTKDFPIIIKYGQLEGKNKTDAYTLSCQSKLEVNSSFGY